MKKIILVGIAVATAMGFTSCIKESVSNEQNEGMLIRETFSASFGQTETKTATSDGGATVTWSANDNVYYYTADGGTVRNCTIATAAASASLTLERETSDTYYNLVYAGNTAPTFTTKTGSSMVFDGVKTAQDGTFASANVSVARTTPGGSGITFKPVTALVKFTTSRTDIKTIVLTGGAGTETVAGAIAVDPTDANPKATLSGTGSTSITATIATPAAGTYYINVLPGTYASGLKLTLKNSSNSIIGSVIASKSIDLSEGGKMINLGDVDSHIELIDLSSTGTANCYIVSSFGAYKFKTVKGNSTTSVGDVKGVKVLWESLGTNVTPSVGDLIKADVTYADNYITFSTNDVYKEGNAVIAAYSDAGCTDGNVLWSWHIWLTDKPGEQVYRNNAGTLMDRNIGAISAERNDNLTGGLFYQWGRKDPFPSPVQLYDPKTTIQWPKDEYVSDHLKEGNTLEYVLSHPTVFILYSNSDFRDWYCNSSDQRNDLLWSSSKSIYDPCPPGWRVPDSGVWAEALAKTSRFDLKIVDQWNKGFDFGSGSTVSLSSAESSVWYPAPGLRAKIGDRLEQYWNMGQEILLWSCAPYFWNKINVDGKAECFEAMEGTEDVTFFPKYDIQKSYGICVRCQKIKP